MFLLGCVNLGSTSAFNALVSTGLILSQLSYAFPAALMLYHRAAGTMGKVLPTDKPRFKLSFGVGPIANILTIVLALLGLVFYDFPAVLPVTPASMSECCVYGSTKVSIIVLMLDRLCLCGDRCDGTSCHRELVWIRQEKLSWSKVG